MSDKPLDIYLIAIGGTGMAPLACLLQELGHRVRGSDAPLYPPMSTLLAEAGITPLEGFDTQHLQPPPDLVVVGNAVPRDNPEALEMERLGLPRMSMAEALAGFFLRHRSPLVIAGTHGKTTTTSLAAWVYTDCGRRPGFLIGGVPPNLGRSFQLGSGPRFIIEGDEYNAAYFDRGPKFLHYRPQTLILTSVEFDHVDLYPDPESVMRAYERLVALLPETGLLIACGDSPEVREVAAGCRCPVVFYGLDGSNDLRPAGAVTIEADGCRFSVAEPGRDDIEIRLPMAGEHNVVNALGVWAAARRDDLETAALARAMARFRGVRRRLEILGTRRGITVIDDFAHHPTAVGKTLAALRAQHPDRRLIAVFEPRTLTAGRSFLFDAYLRALALADRIYLAPVYHASRLPPEQLLDLDELGRRLEAGGSPTTVADAITPLFEALVPELRAGDIVVSMSSGRFEDLPRRLLKTLAAAGDL